MSGLAGFMIAVGVVGIVIGVALVPLYVARIAADCRRMRVALERLTEELESSGRP